MEGKQLGRKTLYRLRWKEGKIGGKGRHCTVDIKGEGEDEKGLQLLQPKSCRSLRKKVWLLGSITSSSPSVVLFFLRFRPPLSLLQ